MESFGEMKSVGTSEQMSTLSSKSHQAIGSLVSSQLSKGLLRLCLRDTDRVHLLFYKASSDNMSTSEET